MADETSGTCLVSAIVQVFIISALMRGTFDYTVFQHTWSPLAVDCFPVSIPSEHVKELNYSIHLLYR